jgi:hypothetical protein
MSFVYFVQDERGRVKIGYSVNTDKRMYAMRSDNADMLRVVRLVDGGLATERWLHKRFDHLWIAGEWFHFHPDMLTVVPPDEILSTQPIKPRLRKTLRETLIEFDEMGVFADEPRMLATALLSSFWEDDFDAFIEWVRLRVGISTPAKANIVPNENEVEGRRTA